MICIWAARSAAVNLLPGKYPSPRGVPRPGSIPDVNREGAGVNGLGEAA
jgi:hypothetical protein